MLGLFIFAMWCFYPEMFIALRTLMDAEPVMLWIARGCIILEVVYHLSRPVTRKECWQT